MFSITNSSSPVPQQMITHEDSIEDLQDRIRTICLSDSVEDRSQTIETLFSRMHLDHLTQIKGSSFSFELLFSLAREALETEDFSTLKALLEQRDSEGAPLFDLNTTSNQYPQSLLSLGCIHNKSRFVEMLMLYGANPTLPCHYFQGETPLQVSCRTDDFKTAVVLFSNTEESMWDALLSAQNNAGQTALMVAEESSNREELIDLLKFPKQALLFEDFIALCQTNNVEELGEFLSQPGTFSAVAERRHWSELTYFFAQEYEEMACFLLSFQDPVKGFLFDDMFLANLDQKAPLLLPALESGSIQTALSLMRRKYCVSPFVSSYEGATSFHLAAEYNAGELITLMHQALGWTSQGNVFHTTLHPEEGVAPIHVAAEAAQQSSSSALEALLTIGVDPNTKTEEGMTPLDYLCHIGQGDRIAFTGLMALLSHGARLEKMHDPLKFETIFLSICIQGGTEEAKAIVSHIKDSTFLHRALLIASVSESFEVASATLDALYHLPSGGSLEEPSFDSDGYQPLHYLWKDFSALQKALTLFPHWVDRIHSLYPNPPLTHALEQSPSLESNIVNLFVTKGANLNHRRVASKKLNAGEMLDQRRGRSSTVKRKLLSE